MKQVYYINNRFYDLKDEDNDPMFPSAYSYAGGRLVFIYQPVVGESIYGPCYRYSKRSKRALKRKLESFLPPAEKLFFRDKNGKVIFRDKHARIDRVKMHGGMYVYYFHGTKPPAVMPELPGFLLNPDAPLPNIPGWSYPGTKQ